MLKCASRSSPLAKKQVEEIRTLLNQAGKDIPFDVVYVETTGDLDKKSSLRTMGKTDFFTKELDILLLRGDVDFCVHSAKDLPDPLPIGICVAALTAPVDPRDVLVLKKGMTLETLPPHSTIATSSIRREEEVKKLRGDLQFTDLRGTIEERLQKLESNEVDGVVLAEAALIRLGLTHLNRIYLPGETAPHQGQLAITTLTHRSSIVELFTCIDSTQA